MSPALVVPAVAALCLGGALAGSMGGCVQILGNDFVVVGDGGGGGGGQGGSGAAGGAGGNGQGGGGGQGGNGLAGYDCDWGLNQHLELARLEGTNQYISSDLLAQRRNDQSARLLVARATRSRVTSSSSIGTTPTPRRSPRTTASGHAAGAAGTTVR